MLLDAAPEGSRTTLERLFAEPELSAEDLEALVLIYLRRVREAVRHREYVDLELVERIASSCVGLLHAADDEASHRLAQVACVYFIVSDDGDGDLASFDGFADDAEVVDIVARLLGRPDLGVGGGLA